MMEANKEHPLVKREWWGLGYKKEVGAPFQFFLCVLFLGRLNMPTMQETWVEKIPWRRAGYPLQCSCLEKSIDRGA